MDMMLETITAMRHQEEDGYLVMSAEDSLYQEQACGSACFTSRGPLHAEADAVDADCRTKMAAWCYQVVDYCKFQRETVEIAMSFLDRYMTTPAGLEAVADRKVYQLAAMTCLYSAVKIHEPEAMDPTLVSNLSRGTYTTTEIEQMESTILQALKWRLNPPTALAFTRELLDLLPLDGHTSQTIYDLTKYQTELAVSEYDFAGVPASTIAYCSLLNSIESLGMDSKTSSQIHATLSQALGLAESDVTMQVQNWLYESVCGQQQPMFVTRSKSASLVAEDSKPPLHQMRRSSFDVSPRSISAAQ